MQHLLTALDDIAAQASTITKVDLLRLELGRTPELKDILVWMLDPTKTFGILDLHPTEGEPMQLNEFLTQLQTRKLTGDAARREAGKFPCPELILRILNKDPKAGFGAALVNKACSGLIPEYPYMRCSLPKHVKGLKDFPWSTGIIAQLKADGMFLMASKDLEGVVSLQSRQGSMFPLAPFEKIVAEIREVLPNNTQIQGEFLVRKDGDILPREVGNGILNSVLKGGIFAENEEVIFQVWDCLAHNLVVPRGVIPKPYKSRFSELNFAIAGAKNIFPIEYRIVYSKEEAYEYYTETLKKGYEGLILKDPNMNWFDGTSKSQIKLKLEVDVDLKIVGFNEGKGKHAATFGSVICQTNDGLLEVSVSGFKDAVRKAIWADRVELLDTIMTVKANQIMTPSSEGKKHSLFLPRFVELRKDKVVADSLQQVIDQFESAING